ncbi:hypothetical protein BaRGS_00022118 [Batillaria attramentaria]|uniref:SUEL-type lectin domain-containing protein n=1 Tax=Batillaria attramentaria TaxID=370345 RepID=A0ABD0KH86_9CAEN
MLWRTADNETMGHLWAVVFVIVYGVAGASAQATTAVYNSSEACLLGDGRNPNIDIICSNANFSGLVSIRQILHGLTPDSMGCTGFTSPESSCCPGYEASRDCLFPANEDLADLRKNCDGKAGCFPNLDRAAVGDACPARDGGTVMYSATYSHFAFVEYTCIYVGLLADVCVENVTLTSTELYLETNVVHTNTEHFNKTCSCRVSTSCGHKLIFHAFDLDLAADGQGQCLETVVLADLGNSSISTSLNCSDNGVGEEHQTVSAGETEGSIFMSQTNAVDFQLKVLSNNTGKILIRVTASAGSPVDVRCGQAVEQGSWQDQCSTVTTSEAPTTTTRSGSGSTKGVVASTTSSGPIGTTDSYNTSEVCLMGRDLADPGNVEIDCSVTEKQGLIVVRRLLHGLPPDSIPCGFASPSSSCCPGYNASRDCMFSTDEGVAELRKRCDGQQFCSVNLDRATVGDACPDRNGGSVSYSDYSTFATVEYTCVNTGLMTDVCDIGTTKRDTELYLETNIFHINAEHANKTCPCSISTQCGHRLIFHAFDLDLAVDDDQGQCLETVVLTDLGNSSIFTSLNCSDNAVDEEQRSVAVGEEAGSIFVSDTNLVSFQLRLLATEGGQVEVRCGSTADQDLWDEHQCPTTTPSPVTTSTTVDGGTTADSEIEETPSDDEQDEGTDGFFANVPAAENPSGSLVRSEHPYDSIRSSPYDRPSSVATGQQNPYSKLVPLQEMPPTQNGAVAAGIVNPVYAGHVVNTDLEPPEGAVGGVDNPVFELDNVWNQKAEAQVVKIPSKN